MCMVNIQSLMKTNNQQSMFNAQLIVAFLPDY